MNSIELEHIINKDKQIKQIFLGVFPSDKLPEKLPFKPCCLILNTDPSYAVGMHWVAIYFDSDQSAHYFDSYGILPFVDSIVLFLNKNCLKVQYSYRRLQSSTSSACGIYCVFFLFYKCRKLSFKDACKIFTPKLEDNDFIICSFIQNTFKVKHKICYRACT